MRRSDSPPGPMAALLLGAIIALAACTTSSEVTATTAGSTTTTAPTTVTSESFRGEPGENSLGDPYSPSAGNGGYNVTHYDLDLDLDVATGELVGLATIEAVALDSLSSFNLDLYELTVSAVAVDGLDVDFGSGDGELTVLANLERGTTFTAVISYSGVAGQVTPNSVGIPNGWIRSNDGLFTVNEPDGAPTWYPVNNHPSDKATYSISVTVDEPYVAVSNGLLWEKRAGDGDATYVYTSDDPMASYLTVVAVGLFEEDAGSGPQGLPIRNYFPADMTDLERSYFAGQADMIGFFADLFGPYPFDSYGSVVVDTDFSAALETQTMSTFGRGVLVLEEAVVAHEIAHQWFGDSVTAASWQDIWLNEGFATYAQWLWEEHVNGPEAFDALVENAYRTVSGLSLLTEGISPELAVALAAEQFPPPGTPPLRNLFNASVYQRGALTLHALRIQVGDDTFFELMRSYTAAFQHRNASTEDFIEIAEEVSGQDLEALLGSWLLAEVVPAMPELGLAPPEE